MSRQIIDPRSVFDVPSAWPNLCTILDKNFTVEASGQKIETSDTPVTGLIDLPCIFVDDSANEKRGLEIESKFNKRTLRVNGYFPSINSRTMKVTVDDLTTWQIRGVRFDSLYQSTFLTLEILQPALTV